MAGESIVETAARDQLTMVLESDISPESIDLGLDLAEGYGLTSLNKIVFLMALCDDTDVPVSTFTEPDVGAMRTLQDVITAFAAHAGTAA
jgi:acyl carrier protein